MLGDILAIKRRREEQAIAAMGEARRALERLEAARRSMHTELVDYNAWQETEKLRLYEKVHNKDLTRTELERYREQVAVLRRRQLQLEEDLAAATRKAEAAADDLQQARRRRADAHREVVKFEEYQRTVDAEQAQAAERREEADTEDIVSGRR